MRRRWSVPTVALALVLSLPAMAQETGPQTGTGGANQGTAASQGEGTAAPGSGRAAGPLGSDGDSGELLPEDEGVAETQGVISGGMVGGETSAPGASDSGAQDREPYSGNAPSSQPGGPGGVSD